MKLLQIILISYLIGCFSSAYFIGKIFKDIDIRSHGSGNVGATNALRVMGLRMGILTFVFDILKGLISVIIGRSLMGYDGGLIAGLFAVVGHNWPIFIGFRGGKGVATSLGVLLMTDWRLALVGVVLGLAVVLMTRYVSLGSVLFLSSQPFLYFLLDKTSNRWALSLTILLALLAIIRHRSNFKRLAEGTENKIGGW